MAASNTKAEQELLSAIRRINQQAAPLSGELIPICILPTLRQSDMGAQVMTDEPRYHALASNSPSLFGHHLCDETRIALFKQSIGSRAPNRRTWRHPPRVYYGNGWECNAWELFATMSFCSYPKPNPSALSSGPFS